MTPLLFYAIIAGLGGYSIKKKWWGGAAFCGAMLVWLLLMQCISAYMFHGTAN
jgi:hypothetical protein